MLTPYLVALQLLALSAALAPVRQIREDGPLELSIHRRLLSELYEYSRYLYYSHTIDCATNVSTTIWNVTNNMTAMLNDTCDLLGLYDMLSAVNESRGRDLHQILKQIVVDACNWTKMIVNITDSASFSQSGEESCPGFLRKHCVAERAKEGWLESRLRSSENNIRHFIEVSEIAISNQPWNNSLSLEC